MKLNSFRSTVGSILSGTALLLAAQPAQAAYPDHAIRVIVPYNAGGGTDVLSRAVAAGIGKELKATVVVENRPGASGMIGTDLVARAAPDGYTLVMTASDTHTINPHVYPKISYDARKDFVPVAQVGYLPYALIVSPSLGVSNINEYVALVKKNPGKMTYASWGVGSSSHVAMEMLNVGQKLDILHVPFTGSAPAMTAIMGGQVNALFVPMSLAKPAADAGKVKLLGLASPKRFAGMPDVPTLAEQGINVVAAPWIGILAPAGTPTVALDTLARAVAQAVKNEDVIKALTVGGLEINVMDSKAFTKFLVDDYALWGDTVKAANIKAE